MSETTRKNTILTLGKTLSQLARALKHHAPSHPSWVGLTQQQQQILHFIINQREQPVYQRDLELNLGIRASSITGLIKILENKGFLTREPVMYDGRLKRLRLTPRTLEIHSELGEETEKFAAGVCEGIDEEALQNAQEVLMKILENLHRMEIYASTR